jgi:hypothetical protein
MDSLKSAAIGAHSGSSGSFSGSSGAHSGGSGSYSGSSGAHSGGSRGSQRSSPTGREQPLPPNPRNHHNSSLSFSPASFPYSSLQQHHHQQQQQQQASPYLHKPEKMFRGRLDLPPEENADLEELEKFAKMFKQKRIKLGTYMFPSLSILLIYFTGFFNKTNHQKITF